MTAYNNSNGDCEPFSDLTGQLSLLANATLTYTVPGNSSFVYKCEFSFPKNSNVYVGYNADANLIPGDSLSAVNSVERNPKSRFVHGTDILNFISEDAVSDVGFSLYSIYQSGQGSAPSPQEDVRITDDGIIRITNDDQIRITD